MVCRRTWISTWPEGSMRPELGRTQYLEEHALEVVGAWKGAAVDVLFGSGGLDLEGDRSACRVGEAQDLGDFVGGGLFAVDMSARWSQAGYLASRVAGSGRRTLEAELGWRQFDRHGVGCIRWVVGMARVVGWAWEISGLCCLWEPGGWCLEYCIQYGDWCVRASKRRRGNDCWSGLD